MEQNFTLHRGDCIEALRAMPDSSVDSVVTDPPYGLSDHKPSDVVACLTAWLAGEEYRPKKNGFMGRAWDSWVPGPEVWREAFRVLKPGGHIVAFAGSRTHDLMSMALRLAGFECRDTVMWVYSQGFPKSMDVSKALDKAAGAEREVVGIDTKARSTSGASALPTMGGDTVYQSWDITAPATAAARQWAGWGTALKPAFEPALLFRKPLVSPPINVLEMVEFQLRERGVRGEIAWKPESASGAAKKRGRMNSSQTSQPQTAETSAGSAEGNATESVGQRTQSNSGRHGNDGQSRTLGASASFLGSTTAASEARCSTPTAESAHAAEKLSEIFSPSTISTAEGLRTESQCTEKSMPSCGDSDFLLNTECFAGIATGLTGSMAHVHIKRDSSGFFLWPQGLPKHVAGAPLTVAENVMAHGTGALNIDGCRVPTASDTDAKGYAGKCASVVGLASNRNGNTYGDWTGERQDSASSIGRFPANVIHDGSPEVLALFPDSDGAGPSLPRVKVTGYGGGIGSGESAYMGGERIPYNAGSGSAARFFYCPKASRKDRNEGLPMGGGPAVSMGASMSEKENAEWKSRNGNHHPTVKPTDLMRYLCRLVTPPGGVVLDPFAGSGSTGKAAILEDFRFIGCELSNEYADIAEARIRHAIESVQAANDNTQIGKTADLF